MNVMCIRSLEKNMNNRHCSIIPSAQVGSLGFAGQTCSSSQKQDVNGGPITCRSFGFIIMSESGLKTIFFLLATPHYLIRFFVPAFRHSANFNADDYAAISADLFSSLEKYPTVICSVTIENLSAQCMDLIEFWISRVFCTRDVSVTWPS
jgi:hypothetical protein